MEERKRRRPHSGELAILIGVGLLILLFATGNFQKVFEWLYRPYVAFVAVVMLVEYVVLKGADRSAQYQRELTAARNRRKEDVLMMERVDRGLEELEASLSGATEDLDAPGGAGQIRQRIRNLRDELRARI